MAAPTPASRSARSGRPAVLDGVEADLDGLSERLLAGQAVLARKRVYPFEEVLVTDERDAPRHGTVLG